MFEQFTPAARQVVVRAQEEARTFGHPWLGTEHLLLGVLAQSDAPGVRALSGLGVTLAVARAALGQLVGRGGPGESDSDADALRTLGIDLDEVRRRVEASFGPGALDRPPRRRRRRRLPWQRSRCEPTDVTGHRPFMPRAKLALERAAGEARALGDRRIGVEHLLLGLLDPRVSRSVVRQDRDRARRGNMAADLLRHLGAQPEVVRARVLADLGKAA